MLRCQPFSFSGEQLFYPCPSLVAFESVALLSGRFAVIF